MTSKTLTFLNTFLSNRYLATATLGLAGTGLYVTTQDGRRLPRITKAFSRGKILPPFNHGENELPYCHRPRIEGQLKDILSSTFSNEYYVIVGQVGSGKSRMIRKIIQDRINTHGSEHQGAPIYISAVQGLSLADTLSKAINFYFDEHISLRYFLDFALGIQKFPERDDHKRLTRVLSIIEQAATKYVVENHKPAVLVIDGIDFLSRNYPGSLTVIQEKAKLWADTNIVKTVFICNDENTEHLLQKDVNLWTRAAKPLYIGDMELEEAFKFVMEASRSSSVLNGSCQTEKHGNGMDVDYIKKIILEVGGRPCRLLSFIYDWSKGVPFEETLHDLSDKEADKLVAISKNPEANRVLTMLKKEGEVKLDVLLQKSSRDVIKLLQKLSIIRCHKTEKGTVVRFDSKLVQDIALENNLDL